MDRGDFVMNDQEKDHLMLVSMQAQVAFQMVQALRRALATISPQLDAAYLEQLDLSLLAINREQLSETMRTALEDMEASSRKMATDRSL
jgi:hypothetical protein